MRGAKYDGRETDAWACGVVLYALVGRRLPFDGGVGFERGRAGGGGDVIGREGEVGKSERRSWLMRIAQGQWDWPVSPSSSSPASTSSPPSSSFTELCGPNLVDSPDAKRMVTRLLVRDPKKRAKVGELWGDEWMVGALAPPSENAKNVGSLYSATPSESRSDLTRGAVAGLPGVSGVGLSGMGVGSMSGVGLSLGLGAGHGKAPPTPPPSAGGKTPPGVEERLDHDESYVSLDHHASYVEQEDAEFPEDQGVLVDREGIDGIACSEVV